MPIIQLVGRQGVNYLMINSGISLYFMGGISDTLDAQLRRMGDE